MNSPLQQSVNHRMARLRRQHEYDLAAGIGKHGQGVSGPFVATPAAYLGPRAEIADFAYVEYDDCEWLIAQARQGVLWAHRLVSPAQPFAETLLRVEWAVDGWIAREEARVQKKKERLQERMSDTAPDLPGPTVRKAPRTSRYVPGEYRPVQALLEPGRLRRTSEEAGAEVTHPPELKERAHALRAEGLLIHEIATEIGVPTPTVTRWVNLQFEQRQRVKARKRKFTKKRRCPTCRKMISNNAVVCRDCFNKQQKLWTREKVIEAIQKWALEKGAPPSYQEWSIPRGPGYPSVWTVIKGNSPAFPSWSAALLAAGFTPSKRRKESRMTPAERAEMRRNARENALKRALAKENTE